MQTVVAITRKDLWDEAVKSGKYRRSTITQTLKDVGFIHCTSPDQTMDVLPRFENEQDVMLLLIDTDKVQPPLKFEPAKSGRPGLFPHIYGPLNIDAIYDTISLDRDANNHFTEPDKLGELAQANN